MPKSHFPESFSSSATGVMNVNLKSILRVTAKELRAMIDEGKSMDEAVKHKEKRKLLSGIMIGLLDECYNDLCVRINNSEI